MREFVETHFILAYGHCCIACAGAPMHLLGPSAIAHVVHLCACFGAFGHRTCWGGLQPFLHCLSVRAYALVGAFGHRTRDASLCMFWGLRPSYLLGPSAIVTLHASACLCIYWGLHPSHMCVLFSQCCIRGLARCARSVVAAGE